MPKIKLNFFERRAFDYMEHIYNKLNKNEHLSFFEATSQEFFMQINMFDFFIIPIGLLSLSIKVSKQ